MDDNKDTPIVWFEIGGAVDSGKLIGSTNYCNRAYAQILVDGRKSQVIITVDNSKLRDTQNEAIQDAINRQQSIIAACEDSMQTLQNKRLHAMNEVECLTRLMGE